MKVILVTSQATYVKDNYYSLLQHVVTSAASSGYEICAAVMVKTVNGDYFKKTLFLSAAGCFNFSKVLLKNALAGRFFDRRVKLFKQHSIPVIATSDINNEATLESIAQLKPDIILNLRTRNIFRSKVLDIPAMGCLNVHHGILPDHRGLMNDFWAWSQQRPVGFSIHKMNQNIDDGIILKVREVDISTAKSYMDVPYLSSLAEAGDITACLSRIAREGVIQGVPNKSENCRYAKSPNFSDLLSIRRKGLKL